MAARPVHTTARPAPPVTLRYVRSTASGIHRVRHGKSFRYTKAGKPVRDRDTLDRIGRLVIPPAWKDVWICADPRGHLQATGTDAKGRRQYRYHAEWSARRNRDKFGHVLRFGAQLPRMRDHLGRHLELPGLPQEKVLATVVAVMDATQIRIGQAAYTAANGSFGLSTMRDRHVRRDGAGVRFVFTGKTGIRRDVRLDSRKLVRLVLRCKELEGQDLFQYIDAGGEQKPIHSGMVNDYIRSISDADFTCKDLRTWRGTVHAARAFLDMPLPASAAEGQRAVNTALDQVADQLGNTRAVCRKYYVHPGIVDSYLDGRLHELAVGIRATKRMDREERLVLRALKVEPAK